MKICLLVVLLLVTKSSFSLGRLGHYVTCEIAFLQLSESTAVKVSQLAKSAGYDSFAQSCYWPDEIRKNKQYDFAKPHHYVNVRRGARSFSSFEHCPNKGCIIDAITAYRQVLSNIDTSSSGSLYVKDPAQALMFLGHFIGDLHQPLHVSYADDAGGNLVDIKIGGVNSSLHWLWDQLLLNHQSWRQMARQLLNELSASQISQWQRSDHYVWANESLQITRAIYQQLPGNHKITRDYVMKNRAVLRQRMQMAGVRIASLLEAIYDNH